MNKIEQNMQDKLGINILKIKTTNQSINDKRRPEITTNNRNKQRIIRTAPASIHLDDNRCL